MADKVKIVVYYSTIDHFSQRRTFATLGGARAYAQKWIGAHPDISETFNYAISDDGVGKIESNIDVCKLFPTQEELAVSQLS
jgi:hypothetical protein